MDDAVAEIERWLGLTTVRDTFSSDEVADLLLDLRTLVTRVPVPA